MAFYENTNTIKARAIGAYDSAYKYYFDLKQKHTDFLLKHIQQHEATYQNITDQEFDGVLERMVGKSIENMLDIGPDEERQIDHFLETTTDQFLSKVGDKIFTALNDNSKMLNLILYDVDGKGKKVSNEVYKDIKEWSQAVKEGKVKTDINNIKTKMAKHISQHIDKLQSQGNDILNTETIMSRVLTELRGTYTNLKPGELKLLGAKVAQVRNLVIRQLGAAFILQAEAYDPSLLQTGLEFYGVSSQSAPQTFHTTKGLIAEMLAADALRLALEKIFKETQLKIKVNNTGSASNSGGGADIELLFVAPESGSVKVSESNPFKIKIAQKSWELPTLQQIQGSDSKFKPTKSFELRSMGGLRTRYQRHLELTSKYNNYWEQVSFLGTKLTTIKAFDNSAYWILDRKLISTAAIIKRMLLSGSDYWITFADYDNGKISSTSDNLNYLKITKAQWGVSADRAKEVSGIMKIDKRKLKKKK